MGKIGVFVERYTISNADEMNGWMRFAQIALRMGHRTDFIFRPDMFKIPEYNAIYIRALTDPLNSAYLASRTAEIHGIRVIDDSKSIRLCCDKVNMYNHLIKAGVRIPRTEFLNEIDFNKETAKNMFALLGQTVVLKAPNSSFSMLVDRAKTVDEFMTIGKRFFRRADRIVVQQFVKSDFDWRVGILDGKPLFVCKYVIPKKRWKISTYTPDGQTIFGPVKAMHIAEVDPNLIARAQEAAAAIGNGLYGVDLKAVKDDYVVIEVNDNPTITAGNEDKKANGLYEQLINYLVS